MAISRTRSVNPYLAPDEEVFKLFERGVALEEFITRDAGGKYLYEECLAIAAEGWYEFARLDPASPDFAEQCRTLWVKVQFPKHFLEMLDQAWSDAETAEEVARNRDDMDRDANIVTD